MKFKCITFLALFITVTSSCEKTVDVKIPKGVFAATNVFATESAARAAMDGLYESMTTSGFGARTNPLRGAFIETLGLASDELTRGSYSAIQQQFYDNNVLPENPTSSAIWASFYFYIYQANLLYSGLEKSSIVNQTITDELMGEAMFIRAISHFYLTNVYNKAPLVLTSDYLTNSVIPNSTQSEIYDQVIKDLEFAISKMSSSKYITAGSRVRPNKWAATAYLAKVYLQMKLWDKAEAAANEVIAQTSYKLEALDNVFLSTSLEGIWQLANPGANIYSDDLGSISGNGTTNSSYRLSPYSVSLFSVGDQRLTKWLRAGTGSGLGTYAPYKFKSFSNTQVGAKHERSTPLRLAEIYLLRAEARAMQDKLGPAIEDLDEVRKRAGAVADDNPSNGNILNPFKTIAFLNPLIGKDDLIDVIYEERLRELFAENGHRWFDAKRSGKSLSIFFGTRKSGIRELDGYFPIPERELDFNPNLIQNDGY